MQLAKLFSYFAIVSLYDVNNKSIIVINIKYNNNHCKIKQFDKRF